MEKPLCLLYAGNKQAAVFPGSRLAIITQASHVGFLYNPAGASHGAAMNCVLLQMFMKMEHELLIPKSQPLNKKLCKGILTNDPHVSLPSL